MSARRDSTKTILTKCDCRTALGMNTNGLHRLIGRHQMDSSRVSGTMLLVARTKYRCWRGISDNTRSHPAPMTMTGACYAANGR